MATHSRALEDGTVISVEESQGSAGSGIVVEPWVHILISKGKVHRGIALPKREARVLRELLTLVREP